MCFLYNFGSGKVGRCHFIRLFIIRKNRSYRWVLQIMSNRVLIYQLACAMSMIPLTTMAQGEDFGTILAVELHKAHGKGWTSSHVLDMRTRDNTSAIDRLSLRSQMGYKVLPWLKASAGFSVLVDHNKRISLYDEDDKEVIKGFVDVGDPKNLREYWGVRLRCDMSLTASYKIGLVKLSLRERWQYTYRFRRLVLGRYNFFYKRGDMDGRVFSAKGKNMLRSRLAAEFKIPNSPITPFVNIEAFNAWDLEKMRYTGGTEWKINKRHVVEAFYRYQDVSYDDDYEPNRHVIGLVYQYHLK